MIEDTPGPQYSGHLGPGSGGSGMVTKQQQDDVSQRPQYSMPGILHFLQTEWARFEMERSQWEVERAELQARIAFLQGERKGQENLKQDLVRRIKMLEFALKQERGKYHKLKYGTEMNPEDLTPPSFDKKDEDQVDAEPALTTPATTNAQWKQGRQLLRQYLQEIGYTDTIVDVRSARVRSLLGLQPVTGDIDVDSQPALTNGEQQPVKRDSTGKRVGLRRLPGIGPMDSALMDTENSIMTTFDFLAGDSSEEDSKDKLGDDSEDGITADDEADERLERKGVKIKVVGNERVGGDDLMEDPETEEVMAEFDFLVTESGLQGGGGMGFPPGSHKAMLGGSDMDEFNSAFGLGELAGLTVTNEADPSSYDISAPKEVFRKTWNAKYTLRSHFDGVRALAFHPVEPVLLTASEDNTVKLWNLQKTVPAKKAASLDVEPVYTFRGHVGPVLSVAVSPSGEQCFTGGMDSSILCWNIPSSNIDPYDSFDGSVLQDRMEGHRDAVWGLSIHSSKMHLLSCSSDGTVRLWSPGTKAPLLNTFLVESERGMPTSVDFVRCDPNQLVVGYTSSTAYLLDLETGQQVLSLDTLTHCDASGSNQINCLLSHPTMPITITAHEDRHIRFFDNTSGKLIHAMVAHLDSVTSLAVDPNGLYLLSGSHDCSIRLWNLDSKTCVQEITSHRKKFDESIHDVAFHPNKPYIASAGADALAKVFV
ncbi:striatin-3-like isoform X2 [Babylonia areolata]|uniref:striatin-3-like isoform X2 n=1 Tax=Babylonia areolata TaxID=304850 RepID=UPI003FD0F9E7